MENTDMFSNGTSPEDMRFESLAGGISLAVSPRHSFGTDAFLLAGFAAPHAHDVICEMGTGCGILSFLLLRNYSVKRCVALDIQEECMRLAQESLRRSPPVFREKITFLQMDLREIPHSRADCLPREKFDMVVCNPPYQAMGRGKRSVNPSREQARHELTCSLPELCRSAEFLLKNKGKFCICGRPARLAEAMNAMTRCKIEPKRLRLVSKTPADAPRLFLLEGRKNARPFLQILPPLYTHEPNGLPNAELQGFYRFE